MSVVFFEEVSKSFPLTPPKRTLMKASSTDAFSRLFWIVYEHLEMISKQCHFKIFLEALSHTNSLVYSRKFFLCL